MDLHTRFNIGDKVVGISYCTKEYIQTCSICEGVGKIKVKDKEFTCPDCYGEGGRKEYKPQQWYIITDEGILSHYDKIIKIDVEITKKETKTQYMLGARYSGSYGGTLWDENDLFKTIEEAELECKKRNEELEKQAINL